MANHNPSPTTRFTNGFSGNPAGRPPRRPLKQILEAALEKEVTEVRDKNGNVKPAPPGLQVIDLLIESAVKNAMKGNSQILMQLLARYYGPTPQVHEISGIDRTPIQMVKVIQPPPRDDPDDDDAGSLRN